MFEHFGIDHKKIDRLPDGLKKNTGNKVAFRFNELGGLFRKNWEHKGVQWAYSSDMEEMLGEQRNEKD